MTNDESKKILDDLESGILITDILDKYKTIKCLEILRLINGLPRDKQIRYSPKRFEIRQTYYDSQNLEPKRRLNMYVTVALKNDAYNKGVREFTYCVLRYCWKTLHISFEDLDYAELIIPERYYKYKEIYDKNGRKFK